MISQKRITGKQLAGALTMALGLLGSAPALAQGRCFIPVQFCDGCTINTVMSVAQNGRCTVEQLNFQAGLISLRVTRKAQNGIAATSVNAYGYSPRPGFTGQDSFSVEVRFRLQSGTVQTTNVNYAVTVGR
jgi:hypothetical protein